MIEGVGRRGLLGQPALLRRTLGVTAAGQAFGPAEVKRPGRLGAQPGGPIEDPQIPRRMGPIPTGSRAGRSSRRQGWPVAGARGPRGEVARASRHHPGPSDRPRRRPAPRGPTHGSPGDCPKDRGRRTGGRGRGPRSACRGTPGKRASSLARASCSACLCSISFRSLPARSYSFSQLGLRLDPGLEGQESRPALCSKRRRPFPPEHDRSHRCSTTSLWRCSACAASGNCCKPHPRSQSQRPPRRRGPR